MNHRNRIPLVAGALAALALAPSCGNDSPLACDGKAPGSHDKAIVLLADGRSPALVDAAREIADDPERAFSSPLLGFHAAGADDPASFGVVQVMTYDDQGKLADHGTYDLAGAGKDSKNRDLSRQREGTCLKDAVAALAPPGPVKGDLVRSLEPAAAATHLTDAGHAAVVATGFGRSTIDRRPIAVLDLSPAGQDAIFRELAGAHLVPRPTDGAVLRLLQPAEDVASVVSEESVKSFADALCTHIGAERCTAGQTVLKEDPR